MMQTEFHQPSWPFYNIINSTLDQTGCYGLNFDTHVVLDHVFSPLFATTEESSEISSDQSFQSMFPDGFAELPVFGDETQLTLPEENFPLNMGGFESISSFGVNDMGMWEDERDGERNIPADMPKGLEEWSPCPSIKSSEASVVLQSLTIPEENMEIDFQLSLHHLLKAYGEAMEMGQGELTKVLVRCMKEKVNPVGETLERVTFNLFQSTESQGEYLKHESIKNFEAAFKAFYQIFPYGRFAHFTANSAILEAIPDDVEVIHIVDFNMGEGVQWPPMIEALAHKQKALRLTSIKQGNQSNSAPWKFEETKRRLYDHARPFGLKLQVEERSLDDLVNEIKKVQIGGGREWLAFNCMVGLLGRRRSSSQIMDFLKIAKELLPYSASNKGIITFGDGEAGENQKNSSGYSSFFDEHLRHYQAICESMEWNFPNHLAEARLIMENLFIAPYVCSKYWLQKWEETSKGFDFQEGARLKGRRLSRQSLLEAKEMVKEGESLYEVRIEGHLENEMVLAWRGSPLIKVSTWM